MDTSKYRSFTVNGAYSAVLPGSQHPVTAENLKEFDSFEDLQADTDYVSYVEDKKEEREAADYKNLRNKVKKYQEELGMDTDKKAFLFASIGMFAAKGLPLPEKTQEAKDWLDHLWKVKYYDVEEGDSVSLTGIDPLGISFLELQLEAERAGV